MPISLKVYYPVPYTIDTLWAAIFHFVPEYKAMKDIGSFLSPATACKDALFTHYLKNDFRALETTDEDFDQAALLKTAYVDLMTHAMFKFTEET
jgi:hypothetical protein